MSDMVRAPPALAIVVTSKVACFLPHFHPFISLMSAASSLSAPKLELEDWNRSMGVVVVPLTPPRFNASLPGDPSSPGSPRVRLAEVMKLHGAGDMADMSDEEEEYLSEALGDWVCEFFYFFIQAPFSARLEVSHLNPRSTPTRVPTRTRLRSAFKAP